MSARLRRALARLRAFLAGPALARAIRRYETAAGELDRAVREVLDA